MEVTPRSLCGQSLRGARAGVVSGGCERGLRAGVATRLLLVNMELTMLRVRRVSASTSLRGESGRLYRSCMFASNLPPDARPRRAPYTGPVEFHLPTALLFACHTKTRASRFARRLCPKSCISGKWHR